MHKNCIELKSNYLENLLEIKKEKLSGNQRKKYTRTGVGKGIGKSSQTVGRIAMGTYDPPTDTFVEIARWVDFDPYLASVEKFKYQPKSPEEYFLQLDEEDKIWFLKCYKYLKKLSFIISDLLIALNDSDLNPKIKEQVHLIITNQSFTISDVIKGTGLEVFSLVPELQEIAKCRFEYNMKWISSDDISDYEDSNSKKIEDKMESMLTNLVKIHKSIENEENFFEEEKKGDHFYTIDEVRAQYNRSEEFRKAFRNEYGEEEYIVINGEEVNITRKNAIGILKLTKCLDSETLDIMAALSIIKGDHVRFDSLLSLLREFIFKADEEKYKAYGEQLARAMRKNEEEDEHE